MGKSKSISDGELELEFKRFVEFEKKNFKINGKEILINSNLIMKYNPSLYDCLLDEPEFAIKKIKQALEPIIKNNIPKFTNLSNIVKISQIRSKHMSKFVLIEGVIKRITKVIPRVVNIKFECSGCGAILSVMQEKKKVRFPMKCSCGKQGNFRILSKETANIQEINLEEAQENMDDLAGGQLQQIRVYLDSSLTDHNLTKKYIPGRKVKVIGIVDELIAFMTKNDQQENLSEWMIKANNIIQLEEDDEINITDEDFEKIKEISIDKPLEKLASSLCPEVQGGEDIKKAIILQMVKGVGVERSEKSYSRPDINILLVGDPGVAKSTLIKSAIQRSPRSRMITHKASKAGLGATVVRDELTGIWSLELGALALSNGSVAGVDELDKFPLDNVDELLEPMEHGCITVDKATIHQTIKANTSILAACNPISGSFDFKKPLARQINLSSPLLNRFDLKFVELDLIDEKKDRKIIQHVLNSYRQRREPEIPINLFKKYIHHCRKLKPILTEGILKNIEDFYIETRKKSLRGGLGDRGMPINIRDAEGVLRLATANAKLRLSDKVIFEDFEIARDLLMACINKLGYDSETGVLDMSKFIQKIPFSKSGKIDLVLQTIRNLKKEGKILISREELFEAVENKNIKLYELIDYIGQLKKEGLVYEPKNNFYSLVD